MLIKTYGAAVQGIDAVIITIEVHAEAGYDFTLVGLPDNAVKESRERIRAAFRSAGLKFPLARVIVNLAPADTKKTGSVHDLAIFDW